MTDWNSLPEGCPLFRVPWDEVTDVAWFDERLAALSRLHGDTVGVAEQFVEWMPRSDPPSLAERLAWCWLIRPELAARVLEQADPELKNEIQGYEELRASCPPAHSPHHQS